MSTARPRRETALQLLRDRGHGGNLTVCVFREGKTAMQPAISYITRRVYTLLYRVMVPQPVRLCLNTCIVWPPPLKKSTSHADPGEPRFERVPALRWGPIKTNRHKIH